MGVVCSGTQVPFFHIQGTVAEYSSAGLSALEINEVNLEDMTLIQEGQVYGKRAVKKVCPNCGKTVDGDYNYCPYCGSKI